MLAVICIIRGCVWAVEQPDRTALAHMPPMQVLLRPYLQPLMVKWSFGYNKDNQDCE